MGGFVNPNNPASVDVRAMTAFAADPTYSGGTVTRDEAAGILYRTWSGEATLGQLQAALTDPALGGMSSKDAEKLVKQAYTDYKNGLNHDKPGWYDADVRGRQRFVESSYDDQSHQLFGTHDAGKRAAYLVALPPAAAAAHLTSLSLNSQLEVLDKLTPGQLGQLTGALTSTQRSKLLAAAEPDLAAKLQKAIDD